jgi:hypothetical protein
MLQLNQEELQAATNATLRAHATSEEAKAVVRKLAAMVEDHSLGAGSRKYKRKGMAEKFEHATGAFLANLLRPYSGDEPEPNGWVYRSMHAKSFTGAAVSHRTFMQLVEVSRRFRLSSALLDIGSLVSRLTLASTPQDFVPHQRC